MAIINTAISAEIQALTDKLNAGDVTQKNPALVKKDFADGLADIIANAIKSATVTVAAGIAVSTTGGSGATTAPGTGTLS